ncbi:Uncharacterised protein [Candidatus Anstonella stagnisolia]|nr:Uncharacterised protein [Candidatus Anstonella stagnisolia]
MEFARLAKDFPAVKASSRTKICTGEEATVFRINKTGNPFFRSLIERNGLAERRLAMLRDNEPVDVASAHKKQVRGSRSHDLGVAVRRFWSGTMAGQVLNFHFMRLANVLFPQHFPKVHALRFCEGREGKMEVRLYTEFVPDGNGAIARKQEALGKFRELMESGRSWDYLRLKSDARERSVCKGLKEAAKKVRAAGLLMDHPEANYHEREGVPVFFEVDGVAMKELVEHIKNMPQGRQKDRANAHLAMLIGAIISALAEQFKAKGAFERESMRYQNWNLYSHYFDGNPAFFARNLIGDLLGRRSVVCAGNGGHYRQWRVEDFDGGGYEVPEFMKNNTLVFLLRERFREFTDNSHFVYFPLRQNEKQQI